MGVCGAQTIFLPPTPWHQSANPKLLVPRPNNLQALLLSYFYLNDTWAHFHLPLPPSSSINHVLRIGRKPSHEVENVTYRRLSVNDDTSSLILSTIYAAVEFIEAALKSKRGRGRTLVHSVAGVSRSPTVVVGYLMKQRGMTLREALGHVVQARPQALPNSGFLAQLKALEIELHGVSTLDLDELPRREADRLALFTTINEICSST